MANVLRVLKLLSDPTRLRLMLLLGAEELTVAELQQILGMGQSRISAHLAQLKAEGLVADRRSGKHIYYSPAGGVTGAVRELIAQSAGEIAETVADRTGLDLVLRKRQDKAGEYFNQMAGRFGRTYIPGRSWRALAHALLRLMPPMVIADLGAGEGTLSQLLARSARRVIAVDNAEAMVEFGTRLAREHGLTNLEYRLGSLEDPPIGPGEVDLALFSQALHHASSPAKALSAAARILRPGGRVVILDLLSHQFEEARTLYADTWLGFGEVELSRLLEQAGFREIDVALVGREQAPPNFQTLLATGCKGEE